MVSQTQSPHAPSGRIFLWCAAAAVLLAGLLMALPGQAAPSLPSTPCVNGVPPGAPANNCFAAPIVVNANSYSNTQSTNSANLETSESASPGGYSIGKTVWYRWTPTITGNGRVSTCGSATSFDTVIAAYTGSALNSLSLQAVNDQACSSNSSLVTFPCVAGVTYQIQVGSWNNGNAGNVQLDLGCTPPCTVPVNDCFADALPIASVPYSNTENVNGAVFEPGEPNPPSCGWDTSGSVWYDWTPAYDGAGTITTASSDYNTVLAVYTGGSVGGLTSVACNDDNPWPTSSLWFSCTAGTTYHIQVTGEWQDTGTLAIAVSGCDGQPPPPCTSGGPANDCFADAIVVNTDSYSVSTDSTGAALETPEPLPFTWGQLDNSLWWAWTPTITGVATVDTCTSNVETVVTAYSGPVGTAMTGLSQITYNAFNCGWAQSSITFPCVAGETYYIQVTDMWQWTGPVDLNMDCGIAPPPFCGYDITTGPSVYTWEEISSTGTPINSFYDYTVANVPAGPAPFAFDMCGETFTHMFPVSKGHICLGTSTSLPSGCSPCCPYSPGNSIPSTQVNRPAIYGVYADIYPGGCNGSPTPSADCMFWKVSGTAPDRVLIYEWKQVPFYSCCYPGPLTFQIKLHETTNCIEVDFQNISGGNGYTKLSGFQNSMGNAGYTFFYGWPQQTLATDAWMACPPPQISAVDDIYTLNEDQGLTTLDVVGNDFNAAPGALTVTLTSSPVLGTASVVGTDIQYTPFDDANGLEPLTYTITNSLGQTATANLLLSINAVNDAPTFQGGQTYVLGTPQAGAQTIPGWGHGITTGPSTATDEMAQSMTFVPMVTGDTNIFASPPTLQRTASAASTLPTPTSGEFAVLRFVPSGSFGRATVCFGPRDSGGTATATNSPWGIPVVGVDSAPQQCLDIVMNSPPVAYFQPGNDAARPGQGITFNPCPDSIPACSYDPDGSIVAWFWEFGDGGTSTDEMPIHVFAGDGTYDVRLTVWDNWGATSFITRSITVSWPDAVAVQDDGSGGALAPIADAGPEITVPAGSLVHLHGSQVGGSDQVRFEWAQVSGPNVTLDNPLSANPTFTAPATGGKAVDLVFSLRVIDGAAVSRLSYVTIHVASSNHAPVADAGDDGSIAAGLVTTLDGSRSSDPDGNPLTYHWEQVLLTGDHVVQISDANGKSTTFTAPAAAGILQFRLQVSDGIEVAEDQVMVVVQPAPAKAPPTFTFDLAPAAPGADATFRAAAGSIDVAWSFGDGGTDTGLIALHHFAPGTYTVTMTVGKGADAQQQSQEVVVTPVAAEVAAQGGSMMLALVGGGLLLAAVAALVALVVLRRRKAE